jgi:hypothetical protein
MQADNQSESDTALRKALRAWDVREPLPPRFRERVWQRLTRQEAQAPVGVWVRLSDCLSRAMSRPALATSYLTVLLLTGLVAGYWHARLDNARASAELGTRYVQMMDPYQMPHP